MQADIDTRPMTFVSDERSVSDFRSLLKKLFPILSVSHKPRHSIFELVTQTHQAIMELSEQALRDHENSPSPTQRVGKPRLNPLDAKLCRFYELLVLFEILQRCLGCVEQSQSSNVGIDEMSSPWRSFINQLSWLCDFTQGGDSSSSIAVEDTASGPQYWLAVNFDNKSKGQPHLENVLQRLSEIEYSSPDDHSRISYEILQSCLQFSSKKFYHYRRMLLKNIRKAKKSLEGSPGSAG